MATSKYFRPIALAAAIIAVVIALFFPAAEAADRGVSMDYADRLFDTSKVHTVDIRIDDWEAFLSACQSEEYSVCDVVIDGEAFQSVGIRGKGNTSLSNVESMNSDRYSFKLEFDQYDSSLSYYGLDKLSLNNLIQDNTMMKDYLVYRMMNSFGAAAPLCSYVYITVNGEDWGLYLAVEAVEESFLLRNYGTDYGELYKPDSMELGGGRGNGQGFDAESFFPSAADSAVPSASEGFDPTQTGSFDPSQMGSMTPGVDQSGAGATPTMPGNSDRTGQGGFGGMGSDDAKLQYLGDDPDSYSTIFDSAKTAVTDADKTRLIGALETLSGEAPSSALDSEAVLRYFVVHNYAVNGDSYTGSMIHNYYLYEHSGQLAMIPWDYNLAFGTFQGGSAASAVNDDIDAPLSVTGSDRPMIDWIFASEEATARYHELFAQFLDTVDVQALISEARELIAPYVAQDPTKFCTYAEFEQGVQTLSAFCSLRTESIRQQLTGAEGTVDASSITLSDMGTMGGRGRQTGGQPQMPQQTGDQSSTAPTVPEGVENMEELRSRFEGSPAASSVPSSGGSVWLLVLSAVFLAAGLVFAIKFRR